MAVKISVAGTEFELPDGSDHAELIKQIKDVRQGQITTNKLLSAVTAKLDTLSAGQPDPDPTPNPDPDPTLGHPDHVIVDAGNGTVDAIMAAARDAPDGALITFPYVEQGIPIEDHLRLDRNQGLMGERPDCWFRDEKPKRNLWKDRAILFTGDAAHIQDWRLRGRGDKDKWQGRAVAVHFPNNCRVTAFNVHLSHFTWSGFSQLNQNRESYYLGCSATSMYRDTGDKHNGKTFWQNGYGWEINGTPDAWSRRLWDDQGRAIDLVRIYNSVGDDCRHAVAANGGARYGVYNSRMSQRQSRFGALLDWHGRTEHWAKVGTHYGEVFGTTFAGGPDGNAWVGLGPRGGIMRFGNNIFERSVNNPIMLSVEEYEWSPGDPAPLHAIEDTFAWGNRWADGDLITKPFFFRSSNEPALRGRWQFGQVPSSGNTPAVMVATPQELFALAA